MRVLVQSTLPCDAELGWERVQTLALLREICSPIIRLAPARGASELPGTWVTDLTVYLRSYLFGFIPLGTRTLRFEYVDPQRREIQTREHDPLVRRWDHRIHFEPLAPGSSRYTDDVEVEAGVLTPLVWAFAQCFYRHRQRRWKRVARRIQNGQP
jgi:hypothetical protein